MKKDYEGTIEEAVYVHMRVAELAGVISRRRRSQLLVGAVWLVALYFLLLAYDSRANPFILLCVFSAIYFPWVVLFDKRSMRRSIRRTCVKAIGTDQPVPCQIELDEEGLVFRRMGQEIRFSWSTVREVKETETTVEVIVEPVGIAVIRKRIFDDPAELAEWKSFIESHR